VISVATRDRVLEYQEWNHVSFGTALLEAGELSERLFLRALSVQFSVPGASSDDLESIPPDILALVKCRIAERHCVIPFRRVGRSLYVAMARPNDEPAIRSIVLLTGLTVVPHVAIAVRVALAIEKHYGVPAAAHFKALARILGETSAAAAWSAPVLTTDVPWTQALCEARNPDQVAIVLLDFLREMVGPAALYRVRRDEAVLWEAWPASALAPGLSIPFSASSLFASLRNAADVFAGPCPDTPANRQVLASVGGRFPGSVVVVPVSLNERTVLYIVSGPGEGGTPFDSSSLGRLSKITAAALVLVTLHRRLLSL
jgi:hypothetical protein